METKTQKVQIILLRDLEGIEQFKKHVFTFQKFFDILIAIMISENFQEISEEWIG